MQILGIKPTHDGCVALVRDGTLLFSIENEKGSRMRNSVLRSETLIRALALLDAPPDAIAISGWFDSPGGYFGLNSPTIRQGRFLGHNVIHVTSSHERSHLLTAYALSPFQQGQPCYALVWEGTLGRFYEIDSSLTITQFPTVLAHPGRRYAHLFFLGSSELGHSHAMPGKLMALAGISNPSALSPEENELVETLLRTHATDESVHEIERALPSKRDISAISWRNGGLSTHAFRSTSYHFSQRIFQVFFDYAKHHLRKGYPLLVSGGCGLNCEWNSRWLQSGLFSDVFVPPCTNDSGSAIGTAADAQYALTGKAKLNWTVYAGEPFEEDCDTPKHWSPHDMTFEAVAHLLHSDKVIAWIQGKYEIGPRALGNRSMLASPFATTMRDRLNAIKGRESYRPIAPVCIEEDYTNHFAGRQKDPHMLYFARVCDTRLKAITHDDGSARVQTVSEQSNRPLWLLLQEFKRKSGTGVLCNTSLNRKGRGFINSKRDLFNYVDSVDIDAIVIHNVLYVKTTTST